MGFFKSIRPWHIGLAFVHMWIYCTTHRPSLTDDVSVMAVMYTVLSACLVAMFLRTRKHSLSAAAPSFAPRAANALDVAAACCMALGAVLLSVKLPVPPAAAVVLGSAAGGAGVGWAYARWCELYARLDIHYAAPLVFLTMAAGSLGKTVIDFLPDVPGALVMACLPFATFACLRASFGSVPSATEPARYYNKRTVGSLRRLALGVAVYSLTVGIIQSVLLEATPSPYAPSVLMHHGSEVLVALAVTAWVTVGGRGLDFSRTWRLILILMATALIFEPHFDASYLSYLLSLVRTAQTFLIILLFLALADVARHSPYHPIAVFALGWCAYTLPFAVGKIAGDHMVAYAHDPTLAMSVIVWVLVIVTLLVLDESSMGNRLIFTELNDGGGDDTPAKRVEAVQQQLDHRSASGNPQTDVLVLRCDLLARDHSLTPREREILELLVRGRSKAHIAEAFFISENTVRGHVKRLYAKLDVHNKQELVDRVEAVAL